MVSLTVQDKFGCEKKYYMPLNVQSPVSVNLGPDRVICEGSQVKFDISLVAGSYLWSGGETSPVKKVNTSGDVWVTVSNICGSVSDTVNVLV